MADGLSKLLAQLSEKANFADPDTLYKILNDYLELPFTVNPTTDMRLEVDPDSLEMLPFSAEVNHVRDIRKELFKVVQLRQAERQKEEARVDAERKAEEQRLVALRKAEEKRLALQAKKTELVRKAQDELLAAELEKCLDKIDTMV